MITPEVYRGIEFIRIGTLPADVKAGLQATFDRSKITKILRDKELLVDCILYADFVRWREEQSFYPQVVRVTEKSHPFRVG
jgi:hypothetical protein